MMSNGQRKGAIALGVLMGSVGTLLNMGSCGNVAPIDAQQPDHEPANVVYEKCENYGKTTKDEQVFYAEHEFPGWTIADIVARASVVGPSTVQIPGYALMNRTGWRPPPDYQSEMLVRDGAAAVICGYLGSGVENNSIAFIWR